MKVLQITTELRSAGAERVLLELCKGLKQKKYKIFVVSLLSLPKKSNIIDYLNEQQIVIYSLNMTKLKFWRIFGLYKIIKKEKPDIIHSHLMHPNLLTRILFPGKKKHKLVNTIHITEERKNKQWLFILDRLTFRFCNALTAVSKTAQGYHAQKIKIQPHQIEVIYNGVQQTITLGIEEITSLRESWGVAHCDRVIGSIGRLHHQKGYDILLKLLPKISLAIPAEEKWALVILGEGEEYQNLIEASPQIENIVVVFPGFHPRAADYISAFDLFIMPSRSEGFGLTLTEAMSHGVPILASKLDVLEEIMGDYENGELVDFSQEEISVEKICKYIYHSKTTPYQRFSFVKMVDDYIQLYKKISK